MVCWLSSLPQWRRFWDVPVSTVSVMGRRSNALRKWGRTPATTRATICPIFTLLCCKSWDVGRYVTVSRVKEESRWGNDKSTLTATIFSRDRSILDTMILEAREK
ncbi:hypothetical protein EDB89DRAFT_1379250 [Lactarius sanguifluus]|nr:hypothetical protein EDB89DRAFT_1379250 [Lactarius sanguifluus]